jgi:signal transduction histidine kinase
MSKLTDRELIDELKERFNHNHQTLNELKEANNKLLTLNKKLEESESMKSHFISNITNEIVNPFSSILGLAEHLNNMKDKEWEQVQSFIRMIYDEAFELDFQLKNIFAAAKLEAGELTPHPTNVDIIELATGVIESYKTKYNDRDLTIELKHETKHRENNVKTFKTDPSKIELILTNLISNSIRYSHDSTQITVKMIITWDSLVISVKDNGIGIKDKYKNKIYDRFFRINNEINSDNKGLGLGLSVTKGILELMNGNILLKDHAKGSEFVVTIPEESTSDLSEEFSSNSNEFFFDTEHEIL